MLKMLVQNLLVLSTLCLSALSSPTIQREDQSATDWDAFHALVEELDSSSIRSALYSLAPKFKDGVFEKERTAMEKVHAENPAVASKLVILARRQANGTTTITTSADPTSSATPTPSSTSNAVASTTADRTTTTSAAVVATTTMATTTSDAAASSSASSASKSSASAESASASSSSAAASSASKSAASSASSEAASSASSTSSAKSAAANPTSKAAASSASKAAASSEAASISQALSSQIHASSKPPVTTIIVAPTAPASATPIKTIPNAVVYSTYGGGLVTVTSQAERVSFTPSTSTHLYYTTLPDGQVQTSTDVVVVNAPVTTDVGAAANSAAASSTNSPSLQSGAAVIEPVFMAQISAVLAGVVALAMLAL